MPPNETASGTNGVRLLIFEESLEVACALAEVVGGRGFSVVGVASRAEPALAIIDEQPFDLAIINVGADHPDSVRVAERVHGLGRRIVFLMGYGDVDPLPPELSGYPTLEKPVDARELVASITETVGAPQP